MMRVCTEGIAAVLMVIVSSLGDFWNCAKKKLTHLFNCAQEWNVYRRSWMALHAKTPAFLPPGAILTRRAAISAPYCLSFWRSTHHAFVSTCRSADRRRGSSWPHQQVHTYGGSIKSILNAVVVIIVVIWLMNVFGLLDSIRAIRIGRS